MTRTGYAQSSRTVQDWQAIDSVTGLFTQVSDYSYKHRSSGANKSLQERLGQGATAFVPTRTLHQALKKIRPNGGSTILPIYPQIAAMLAAMPEWPGVREVLSDAAALLKAHLSN